MKCFSVSSLRSLKGSSVGRSMLHPRLVLFLLASANMAYCNDVETLLRRVDAFVRQTGTLMRKEAPVQLAPSASVAELDSGGNTSFILTRSSPPTTQLAMCGQFECEPGKSQDGRVIKVANLQSIEGCSDRCCQTDGCVGFVWDADEFLCMMTGTMKEALPYRTHGVRTSCQSTQDSVLVRGTPYVVEAGTCLAMLGTDVRWHYKSATTVDGCKVACSKKPRCIGASFQTSTSKCYHVEGEPSSPSVSKEKPCTKATIGDDGQDWTAYTKDWHQLAVTTAAKVGQKDGTGQKSKQDWDQIKAVSPLGDQDDFCQCLRADTSPIPDLEFVPSGTEKMASAFKECAEIPDKSSCLRTRNCKYVPSNEAIGLPGCVKNDFVIDILDLTGCGWVQSHLDDECSKSAQCDGKGCTKSTESTMDYRTCEQVTACEKTNHPPYPPDFVTCMRSVLHDFEGQRKCFLDSLPEQCQVKALMLCESHTSEASCRLSGCEWRLGTDCSGQQKGICELNHETLSSLVPRPNFPGNLNLFYKQIVLCGKMPKCSEEAALEVVPKCVNENLANAGLRGYDFFDYGSWGPDSCSVSKEPATTCSSACDRKGRSCVGFVIGETRENSQDVATCYLCESIRQSRFKGSFSKKAYRKCKTLDQSANPPKLGPPPKKKSSTGYVTPPPTAPLDVLEGAEIYLIHKDLQVFKAPLRNFEAAQAELASLPSHKIQQLAFAGNTAFAVDAFGLVYKQVVSDMTSSSLWVKVSNHGPVVSIAIHRDSMIYATTPPGRLYKQNVCEMTLESIWEFANHGPVQNIYIDVNGDDMYGINRHEKLVKQNILTMTSDSDFVDMGLKHNIKSVAMLGGDLYVVDTAGRVRVKYSTGWRSTHIEDAFAVAVRSPATAVKMKEDYIYRFATKKGEGEHVNYLVATADDQSHEDTHSSELWRLEAADICTFRVVSACECTTRGAYLAASYNPAELKLKLEPRRDTSISNSQLWSKEYITTAGGEFRLKSACLNCWARGKYVDAYSDETRLADYYCAGDASQHCRASQWSDEVVYYPMSGDEKAKCDKCVQQFADSGGCTASGNEVHTHIPNGCYACGHQAADYCRKQVLVYEPGFPPSRPTGPQAQDCLWCVQKFQQNGGCPLLGKHEVDHLIPPGCEECGEEAGTHCGYAQAEGCVSCIQQFEMNGGCPLLLANDQSAATLIPSGCELCGPLAAQHCQDLQAPQRLCQGHFGPGGSGTERYDSDVQWCCTACNCKDMADQEPCKDNFAHMKPIGVLEPSENDCGCCTAVVPQCYECQAQCDEFAGLPSQESTPAKKKPPPPKKKPESSSPAKKKPETLAQERKEKAQQVLKADPRNTPPAKQSPKSMTSLAKLKSKKKSSLFIEAAVDGEDSLEQNEQEESGGVGVPSVPESQPLKERKEHTNRKHTSAHSTALHTSDGIGEACAVGCRHSYLADGMCDKPCNVAACNYDNGDCKDKAEQKARALLYLMFILAGGVVFVIATVFPGKCPCTRHFMK